MILTDCRRQVLVLVAAMFLSACAVSPTQSRIDAVPQWSTRLTALESVARWTFNGRASIYDGKQAWHVNLTWQQDGPSFDLRFNGPLASGAAHLFGNETETTLQLSNQVIHVAPTPEMLLQRELGVWLPVGHLQYWLLGRPDPAYPLAGEWDHVGQLLRMTQDGWDIEYREYATATTPALPRKIEITHPQLRVKIVIDQWQLG